MEIPLDTIYYINLDQRLDKRQHIETNVLPFLTGLQLPPTARIERFPAIWHPNGAIGCSMSHLEIAKKAKAARARYYMVLEDDFEFLVGKEDFQAFLYALFNNDNDNDNDKSVPVDFKVVMLAYNALNRATYNHSHILERTTNAQTTSGFIVNCAYLDELISTWEYGLSKFLETGEHWNWACDQCWKVLQKEKWFISQVRIGKQASFVSDIGGTWVVPKF